MGVSDVNPFEMLDFNIPTLNTGGLLRSLRRELRYHSLYIKLLSVISSVAFPICECYIINRITSTSDAKLAVFLWRVLLAVGIMHLIVFSITFISQTPLAQFLVEFDQMKKAYQEGLEKSLTHEFFSATFRAAVQATQASLLVIEKLDRELALFREEERQGMVADAVRENNPFVLIGKLSKEVLRPWYINRSDVFWYKDGDAFYNFAIYMYDKSADSLSLVTRACDGRITRTDRSWKPGCGHVGICFSQGRTIVSIDAAADTGYDITGTDRPEDKIYYRSIVCAPIFLNGEKVGVVIITSSKPAQFEAVIHGLFVEVLAKLLALAIERSRTIK